MIQLVGYITGQANLTTGISLDLTSLTGGIDTTARAGDLVIVTQTFSTATAMSMTTAGYTALASTSSTADSIDTYIGSFWKFMDNTPDTTAVVPDYGGSSTLGIAVIAVVYRGVEQVSYNDVTTTTGVGINGCVPTPPAITPSTSGAVIVSFGAGAYSDSGATSYTAFGNMTGVGSTSSDQSGTDAVIGAAEYTSWTSGAFTPTAWTFTGATSDSSDSWCGITVALRPKVLVGVLDRTSTNGGDSYIRADLTGDNQGTNTGFSVQWYQPFLATNHGVIQFTLPATDLGTINGIRLYLYTDGGDVGGSDLVVRENNSSFTEGTVTWSSAPSYSATVIDTVDSSTTGACWKYFQLQGTGATNSLSKTWGDTISLRIRFTTESGSTKNYFFNSKENSANRPVLEIDYTPNAVRSQFFGFAGL